MSGELCYGIESRPTCCHRHHINGGIGSVETSKAGKACGTLADLIVAPASSTTALNVSLSGCLGLTPKLATCCKLLQCHTKQ